MKKLNCLGAIATVLIAASALAGCSGTSDPPMNSGGSGNTGGSGSTAGTGGGGGGKAPGTKLTPPSSYVSLSGADAMPGGTAPAAWASNSCAACHGNNGEGVSGLYPEVRHTPATYATWVVKHGRAGTAMLAFPDLAEADLTSIITWLNAMPKPMTPMGLYKDFCGNCHGPLNPTGGNVAINIVGESMTELTQKVRMGEGTDPGMRDNYMPAFTTTELTDAELAQIAQYIMAK